MCTTCGCAATATGSDAAGVRYDALQPHLERETLPVLRGLLARNDAQAEHNRRHFARHGVLAVNLMSSPGAGKTSLLEATIGVAAAGLRIAVIEGDLATENDAERIRARGVPAVQITTGNACHLDAQMIHAALHDLTLDDIDVLFIENVGNLVCPASFDLGQHCNVALLSVPEGDDKPAKYPVMFRAADLVLITKVDLLAVLDDFEVGRAERHVRELGSAAPVMQVAARKAIGVDAWVAWVREQLAACRAGGADQGTARAGARVAASLPGGAAP
jgi:hydrogenase nickel incorporation protein HypB